MYRYPKSIIATKEIDGKKFHDLNPAERNEYRQKYGIPVSCTVTLRPDTNSTSASPAGNDSQP